MGLVHQLKYGLSKIEKTSPAMRERVEEVREFALWYEQALWIINELETLAIETEEDRDNLHDLLADIKEMESTVERLTRNKTATLVPPYSKLGQIKPALTIPDQLDQVTDYLANIYPFVEELYYCLYWQHILNNPNPDHKTLLDDMLPIHRAEKLKSLYTNLKHCADSKLPINHNFADTTEKFATGTGLIELYKNMLLRYDHLAEYYGINLTEKPDVLFEEVPQSVSVIISPEYNPLIFSAIQDVTEQYAGGEEGIEEHITSLIITLTTGMTRAIITGKYVAKLDKHNTTSTQYYRETRSLNTGMVRCKLDSGECFSIWLSDITVYTELLPTKLTKQPVLAANGVVN